MPFSVVVMTMTCLERCRSRLMKEKNSPSLDPYLITKMTTQILTQLEHNFFKQTNSSVK